ncbi:CNP1-like family protein [Pigmentiphaga humi]|uniref:CNP1-like family protein n=1 Tax=Pigmentiphaga humi TaxID=2478468 RepID=A0A3P4B1N7_9BURK|nr:CNP1-like family protein [Pigmentiphaga humi]VCU69486.1 CNP1-like family protein [Pigmentiphaga humi]
MHSDFAGQRAAAWLAMACLALGLAGCGTPRTDGNYLLDDIDAQRTLPDAGWDALKSQLPPVPTAKDVLPVEPLTRVRGFSFGVDPRSIEISPGLIVRYTLRAVSDAGAENISYESVRCGTREWRTVAIDRPGAGWQRALNDEWRVVLGGSIQQTLRNGVFCSGGAPASPKKEDLIYRLRNWERYTDGLAGDGVTGLK